MSTGQSNRIVSESEHTTHHNSPFLQVIVELPEGFGRLRVISYLNKLDTELKNSSSISMSHRVAREAAYLCHTEAWHSSEPFRRSDDRLSGVVTYMKRGQIEDVLRWTRRTGFTVRDNNNVKWLDLFPPDDFRRSTRQACP